jgi:hypothetical protein
MTDSNSQARVALTVRTIAFLFLVLAGTQTAAAGQEPVWPGMTIDTDLCFANDRYVTFREGALYMSIDHAPQPPAGIHSCFLVAVGPGFVGVFTLKVAAQAENFRIAAIEIVDEERRFYYGRRLTIDRQVKSSANHQGRLLVIAPENKARRFVLVMNYNGPRRGTAVMSFHAINPIWESITAGWTTGFNEMVAEQFVQGSGAKGQKAEILAAIAQLAIAGVTSDGTQDTEDFVINALSGVVPHLTDKIPPMGTSWVAQTYLNIKRAMYKGFDRRYPADAR